MDNNNKSMDNEEYCSNTDDIIQDDIIQELKIGLKEQLLIKTEEQIREDNSIAVHTE